MSTNVSATQWFCYSAPPSVGPDADPGLHSEAAAQRLVSTITKCMENLPTDQRGQLYSHVSVWECHGEGAKRSSPEPGSQDPSPFDGSFRVFNGQEPLVLDKELHASPADETFPLAVASGATKLSQPLPERSFSTAAIRVLEIP